MWGSNGRMGRVSDIHADPEACKRALRLLAARDVDKIVCAADMVESGPDGDAVVSMLQAWLMASVRGNHGHKVVIHATEGG